MQFPQIYINSCEIIIHTNLWTQVFLSPYSIMSVLLCPVSQTLWSDLMASLKALLCNHLFRPFINNKVKYGLMYLVEIHLCDQIYLRCWYLKVAHSDRAKLRNKSHRFKRGWFGSNFTCVSASQRIWHPFNRANKEGPLRWKPSMLIGNSVWNHHPKMTDWRYKLPHVSRKIIYVVKLCPGKLKQVDVPWFSLTKPLV